MQRSLFSLRPFSSFLSKLNVSSSFQRNISNGSRLQWQWSYLHPHRRYYSPIVWRHQRHLHQQKKNRYGYVARCYHDNSSNIKRLKVPLINSNQIGGWRTKSTFTFPLPSSPKSYPYDVTIGATTVTVHEPKDSVKHLIPNYSSHLDLDKRRQQHFLTNTDLAHLEWMMRKEALLKQDIFLIGPPGGYKRRLAGLYGYLFGRGMEVIQISRDSTEADIKQIREIRNKSVVYFDQASIRTALAGNILVLDGLHQAERNVLPILNNLLENREMHLEDGRHLIPHTRFDALVAQHGLETVKDRWRLERVHPDFRVIALGLPVPAFRGAPLDPPLRSRFQARNVDGAGREEVVEVLTTMGDDQFNDGVRRMVDLAYGINYMNSREFKEKLEAHEKDMGVKRVGEDVPWFVVDSLFDGVRVLENISKKSPTRQPLLLPQVFKLMYPFQSKKIDSLITEQLGEVSTSQLNTIPQASLSRLHPPPLPSQLSTLSLLYELLKLPDCQRIPLLYGAQGCGKSQVAEYAAGLLNDDDDGRDLVVIQVYKDMSTRDLFQVRGTDPSGDTVWRESPLVEVAMNGGVCVLDGVENLHESVVGVLGGLMGGGEVMMPDGGHLLSRWGKEGGNNNLFKVHPDFRLIGVANSTDLKLTPEISSVFMVFNVEMGMEEEVAVCGGDGADPGDVNKVLNVLRELRRRAKDGDKGCLSLSRGLSVSQIRRIVGRGGRGGDCNLYRDIMNAVCGQYLPMMERDLLREILEGAGIKEWAQNRGKQRKLVEVKEGKFRIGSVEGRIANEAEQFQAKIPKGGIFFDIDQHVEVLERIADDFFNGRDHLLVVGNQGVGKNKIVDRFLEVVGRGREYLQLHRDTTVSSLTTNQKIEAGIIKTEDSPLVNAAKHGLVLVIDEADKAPAHVTAVLKTLAERGEMVMGDGRRIVNPQKYKQKKAGATPPNNINQKLIPLHPNFRMIVLANRPGFPFLGNSFYGSMSHLFSVNPVDNPGMQSEVQLLTGYGPNVDSFLIKKVAGVFGELRKLSDEGVLGYPYSTREAVHVIKHLEAFPGDLNGALGNVFDFDWFDDESYDVVKRVVETRLGHDIMSRGARDKGSEAIGMKIVEWSQSRKMGMGRGGGQEGGKSGRTDFSGVDPKEGRFDPTGAAHVGGNTWQGGSGGMSTAGLGGVGGPYRLTDGNPVFQVSPQAKQSISPEVLQKARELNRKLYADKLKELKMSPYDSTIYNDFLNPILPQIQSLRNILNSLQAKSDERKWVKHQTSGDLDDGKLVEGIIGDMNVYRGRIEKRPEVGDPIIKPKLLRLLVDVSGSMYRFNGYDGRLDRVMSCALMVMEGIGGSNRDYSNTLKFEIYGHSGDEYDWKLVGRDEKLADEKSRFLVLKELFLHSQFCSSGDHTLESSAVCVEQLGKLAESGEFDEVFLVVLSDANFERYGISVEEFGRVLKKGSSGGGGSGKVKAYCVFIGSLGDQAERLKQGLKGGLSFVCLDVGELPKILQRIFSEGILGSSSGGGGGGSGSSS